MKKVDEDNFLKEVDSIIGIVISWIYEVTVTYAGDKEYYNCYINIPLNYNFEEFCRLISGHCTWVLALGMNSGYHILNGVIVNSVKAISKHRDLEVVFYFPKEYTQLKAMYLNNELDITFENNHDWRSKLETHLHEIKKLHKKSEMFYEE